jgi:hypothetical protein
MDCPICEKLSEKKTQNNCKHRVPMVIGYGFGRVSGWLGIGATYRCPDCSETLWFDEDYECSENEISKNKIKKDQNKIWGECVARGEFE